MLGAHRRSLVHAGILAAMQRHSDTASLGTHPRRPGRGCPFNRSGASCRRSGAVSRRPLRTGNHGSSPGIRTRKAPRRGGRPIRTAADRRQPCQRLPCHRTSGRRGHVRGQADALGSLAPHAGSRAGPIASCGCDGIAITLRRVRNHHFTRLRATTQGFCMTGYWQPSRHRWKITSDHPCT